MAGQKYIDKVTLTDILLAEQIDAIAIVRDQRAFRHDCGWPTYRDSLSVFTGWGCSQPGRAGTTLAAEHSTLRGVGGERRSSQPAPKAQWCNNPASQHSSHMGLGHPWPPDPD